MADSFDVILKLIMDDAATARIKEGASSVAEEYAKIGDEVEKTNEEIKKQEKIAVSAMKQEASAIRKLAGLRSKELAELKERAAWIDKGAKPMFAAGVAGMAAITALAKNYIDTTEQTNEVTKRWADSANRVSDAQMRIGKISAEAILPLYEKLSEIAQKAASFAEKNPGVIEGGLKASIVLAGLGGLGMIASKGLTLYADFKMIAVGDMQLLAAKMMSDAANKQLTASTGRTNPFSGTAPAAGTAAAGAGTAGAAATGGLTTGGVLATAAAFTVLNLGMSKVIDVVGLVTEKVTGLKGSGEFLADTFSRVISVIPGLSLIAPIRDLSQAISGVDGTASKSTATLANWAINLSGATQAANQASGATRNQAGANAQLAGTANNAGVAVKNTTSGIASFGQSIVSWFSRIFSLGGGGSKPPVHDYTGYAYSRTYAMAQDGKRQFVMSGNMTRMAEQMLGGQLNQQMVMSAMTGGGGSTVWNDQRKFSGEYTKSMRKAQRADTLSVLNDVARKL